MLNASTIKPGIGILSIGTHLPAEVRKNSWWSEEIVDSWRAHARKSLVRPDREPTDPWSLGVRRITESFENFRDDPFKGARERRIMPRGTTALDMETAAAKEALNKWGGDASTIDALFVYSQLPDFLTVSNAAGLHERLGLSPTCMSLGIEVACNSFLTQLELAMHMIRAGRIRNALLVQSSGIANACRSRDQYSVWFGDGASAVVVGEVAPPRGVLSLTHRTDGSFHRAVVSGCPGSRWWSGEPVILYNDDVDAARRMLMGIGDTAKEVTDEALKQAGVRADEVNFYATHQSTHWFRAATQDYLGLSNAKSVDTFEYTASLAASNAPFMLAIGEREGLLKSGDIVAIHTGGGGIMYSAAIVRWGSA